MKLIGELKKQVESTNTKEEAKDVIENAGMELTDNELDNIVGGSTPPIDIKDPLTQLEEEKEERKRLEEQMNNNDDNIMAPLLFGVPN